MRFSHKLPMALAALATFAAVPAQAISNFQHIVIVVQENRTPDNLFHGLCITTTGNPCSTTNPSKYNIQVSGWHDKHSTTGTTQPTPENLGTNYDVGHSHQDWVKMCDQPDMTQSCNMDGAGDETCGGPSSCPFTFVATHPLPGSGQTYDLTSYLTIAKSYGWANLMFQTNQGPSFPAHQFLFGATSADDADDDHAGTFAAENSGKGCISPGQTRVATVDSSGTEHQPGIYPCFYRDTMAELLEARSASWRYYTTPANQCCSGFWTAPYAIERLCGTDDRNTVQGEQACPGSEFSHVDFTPQDVLNDVGVDGHACNLAAVSWVIPTGVNSDHAGFMSMNTGGPAWVSSIVNAIGTSPCTNPDGSSYWNSTAIIVVWDDWGGWYDHEPPVAPASPQAGYQYGFRVPLLFVSAYTPVGYIDNTRMDFGSIARFVEHNFGITEGTLTFADSRTCMGCTLYDLTGFYNLNSVPRIFVPIPTRRNASWFLHHKQPVTPPDDY